MLVAFMTLVLMQVPVESPVVPNDVLKRPCKALAAGEVLNVDFADVALTDFARLVSCALARNLLLQPSTLGDKRVTVMAPRPVGARALETLWHAVLADHDLVEERSGAFEVIRPVRR